MYKHIYVFLRIACFFVFYKTLVEKTNVLQQFKSIKQHIKKCITPLFKSGYCSIIVYSTQHIAYSIQYAVLSIHKINLGTKKNYRLEIILYSSINKIKTIRPIFKFFDCFVNGSSILLFCMPNLHNVL